MDNNEINKVHRVQLADYTPVSASEKEDRGGWVKYGEDNLFPKYIIELYETAPIHGPLCTSISKMIAGDGLVGDESVVAMFGDKKLDRTAFDLKVQGGFYLEVIWSNDRTTVAQINHLPFENCRLSIVDETDEVTGVWYSKDWANYRKKGCEPMFIPRFNTGTAADEPRQVYFHFANRAGSQYYGKPDYFSVVNYIELARQIGIYHVNNIMNGFFPSFIISQFNGVPDPETKREIIAEWNRHASGARNAGKAFFTFHEAGTTPPNITTFPLSDADKQYQYLEESQTRQIMIGHRVTSPLLFGIRDSTGLGSNADELRQSLAIFNAYVVKPAQQDIVEALNVITGKVVQIKPYSLEGITIDENEDAANVSDTALNGAQITSLVDIVAQVSTGLLPKDSAKSIVQAAFPTLSVVTINQIFDAIIPGSVQSNEVLRAIVMSAIQKKKIDLRIPESFEPTREMAAEAELGLKWREEYGRGGTAVGVARARDISNMRNLSFDTVKRMNSYFSRHAVDKEATGWNDGEEGFPTAGRIAWQLWGGDAGRDWSARIIERYREQMSAVPSFSEEDEQSWIGYLADKGEVIDTEEWELIREDEAGDHAFESDLNEKYNALQRTDLALNQYANGDEKSRWGDSGLYKLRYAYSQNLSADSRDFCREMVGLSKSGRVFRYEDIARMSDEGVNGSFAPQGSSNYDIFTWKGGVYCHHFWKRQIYFRKRDENGKFLPNKGLENDKRVGNVPFLPQKGEEGIAPIDTPTRGSLKNI